MSKYRIQYIPAGKRFPLVKLVTAKNKAEAVKTSAINPATVIAVFPVAGHGGR